MRKNRTLVGWVVGILVVGLVGSYVPLIFTSPPRPVTPVQNIPSPASESEQSTSTRTLTPSSESRNSEQAASLPEAVTPPPSTSTKSVVPGEGFDGLEEEGKSLEELNKLLN